MYGPLILEDRPLLEAVDKYNKEELRKEYNYGNYQDKGLPKNKEFKLGLQPYIRKDNLTTVEINDYLRNLRMEVGK